MTDASAASEAFHLALDAAILQGLCSPGPSSNDSSDSSWHLSLEGLVSPNI